MQSNKPDSNFIIDFFQSIKLRPARDNRQFWAKLREKYNKKIIDELAKIVDAREDGGGENLYEFKNQTLNLSMDFSSYSADLYRRFFEWFISAYDQAPKRLLDIGCDNGIVTCFLGKLFPESEILGIDISNNSIKCARELSCKLGLTNVRFEKKSLSELSQEHRTEAFDTIVSVRSLHEVFGRLPDVRFWSLKECTKEISGIDNYSQVSLIGDLLEDKASQFISFDRIQNVGHIAILSKIFERFQLHLTSDRSKLVRFHEVGEEQSMPALVFSKQRMQGDENIVAGIYELYIKNECVSLEKGKDYEGFSAEAVFEKIKDRKFVKGMQINFNDGSGQMRYELWNTADLLLVYEYSNIGYRLLRILDLNQTDIAIDQLDIAKTHYEPHAEIVFLNTIYERDLL